MLQYMDILNEIHDLLMRDTAHIFIYKAKQLTFQKVLFCCLIIEVAPVYMKKKINNMVKI